MELGFNDQFGVESGEERLGLRPLGWSELCARVAAAQDLRREVLSAGTGADGSGASFHRPAARLLQDIVHSTENGKSEDPVNHYLSGIGKGDGATARHTPNVAAQMSPSSPSQREKP